MSKWSILVHIIIYTHRWLLHRHLDESAECSVLRHRSMYSGNEYNCLEVAYYDRCMALLFTDWLMSIACVTLSIGHAYMTLRYVALNIRRSLDLTLYMDRMMRDCAKVCATIKTLWRKRFKKLSETPPPLGPPDSMVIQNDETVRPAFHSPYYDPLLEVKNDPINRDTHSHLYPVGLSHTDKRQRQSPTPYRPVNHRSMTTSRLEEEDLPEPWLRA